MKASEAHQRLYRAAYDNMLSYWTSDKSKVDETKTVTEMLRFWLHLFESNPDMRVGSIIQYNVKRDFHGF